MSQWGCDVSFLFFPIETRDSLHLCLLFWSGSDDPQPLLGAPVYPCAAVLLSKDAPWLQEPAPDSVSPAIAMPSVLSTSSSSIGF